MWNKGKMSRRMRMAVLPMLGIYDIIAEGLVRRDDWIELAGAVYPSEQHRKRNWMWRGGKFEYVGTLPHNPADDQP